jgi:ABC-type nitrate/sulfonate/bicarbonate transport system permease component
MKKLQSITNKLYPTALLLILILIWQLASASGLVPKFMLPSPLDVLSAFINSFPELMEHAGVSLTEAFAGLSTSIVLALLIALLMDRFEVLYKALHPILVTPRPFPQWP